MSEKIEPIYKGYERIADIYDEHYTSPEDLVENAELKAMIDELLTPDATVLDIGCGTGLVLDLCDIAPENYLGVDPAKHMIDKLLEKHPDYTVVHGTYEEHDFDKVDVAVAVFSGHYINDNDKKRLPEQADRYLYMFAKPGYAPDWYYTPEEQEVSKHMTDYDELEKLFELTEWHNYLIAYKK